VIANLNTRLSAAKILQSRLRLIQAYLSETRQPSQDTDTPSRPETSHSLLRSINSLVSHLSLINPGTTEEFTAESLAQANDVALASLLGAVGENVQQLRELGRKFAITQSAKRSQQQQDVHSMMQSRMGEDIFHGRRGMV
jgi:COP9 signalosome complex subunit 6